MYIPSYTTTSYITTTTTTTNTITIHIPLLLPPLTLPLTHYPQATRRLVMDASLRKRMGEAAREFSWKFERNIILQQMAENYKVRKWWWYLCVF